MEETSVHDANSKEMLDNYAFLKGRNFLHSVPDVLPRNFDGIQEDFNKVNCPDLLRNADVFLKLNQNTEGNLLTDETHNRLVSNDYNGNLDLHDFKFQDTAGTNGNFQKICYIEALESGRGHFSNESYGNISMNTKISEAPLSDGIEYIALDVLIKNCSRLIDNNARENAISNINQYLASIRSDKHAFILNESKNRKNDLSKEKYVFKQTNNDMLALETPQSHKPENVVKSEIVDSKLRKLTIKHRSQSFDDRPISSIGVDYKFSSLKSTDKLKSPKNTSRLSRNLRKSSTTQKIYQKNNNKPEGIRENTPHNNESSKVMEKEILLTESKYAKIPKWAQHTRITEEETGKLSALCKSTHNLEIHSDSASKDEPQREVKGRLNRDEIRRRLAVETGNEVSPDTVHSPPKNYFQTREDEECDFYTKQTRLQIETRLALSQAKDLARLQMSIEKQKQRLSPITGIIRNSLGKVGIQISLQKRRVSRQMLTDMSIVQLQIIFNDLHNQVEYFNALLVRYLEHRDELHLDQDSKLADIENLTRYL